MFTDAPLGDEAFGMKTTSSGGLTADAVNTLAPAIVPRNGRIVICARGQLLIW